jgi:transposase
MLPDQVAFVIGVDTHRDTHELAICERTGRVLGAASCASSGPGYRHALALAARQAPGARLWAVEGSGSYGRGLVRFLAQHGERIVEIDRPQRRDARSAHKNDTLDAIRAAREAIARDHLATPRAVGEREALRVLYTTREGAISVRRAGLNQLHALIITAPEPLRQRLRTLPREQLLVRCTTLRPTSATPADEHATRLALRSTAKRVLAATREATTLAREITQLVERLAPALLAEHGVGPISAAQILIAWSHPGRIHSEAAFASLAGTSPIATSSGQTIRHRLNRGGDRQLNRALWTIARIRSQSHAATIAYTCRRRAEGKTDREIQRCIKRYLARRFYRLLTTNTTTHPRQTTTPIALGQWP